MDSISDAAAGRGGVVTVRSLLDAGFRRSALDRAIAIGHLERVRRGWVSVRGADAHLVAAARSGVVVTCVTQARRLGLWTLSDDVPHVGAPPHAGRMTAERAIVHWSKPVVPRHPDALVDGIENVLVLVARCQPHEVALAVWESALRQRLVDAQSLARLALPPAARRVLSEATPFADSGLETFIGVRLRWTRLPVVAQVWILGHHVDFLIGERLVLQVDGGQHVGAQRERDLAHDAELMLRGFHVIRVGYHQVIDGWPDVQARLMRAIAQGLHRADRPQARG